MIKEFEISSQSNFIKGAMVLVIDDIKQTPGQGDIYKIPRGCGNFAQCSIVYDCRNGTGNIKYTISSIEKIEAENAVWETWDNGQTTNTIKSLVTVPITGIYQINVTGTTGLEVLMQ